MAESPKELSQACGDFAFSCFQKARATDLLRKVYVQENFSFTESLRLSQLQLPLLVKLVELRSEVVASREFAVLRKLAYFPLAGVLEENGSFEAVKRGRNFVEELLTEFSQIHPVYFTLDRWQGRFSPSRYLEVLRTILLDFDDDGSVLILGPSTGDIHRIRKAIEVDSKSSHSIDDYFALLRELGVKSLEGGSNLETLKDATRRGFSVRTAQKIAPDSLRADSEHSFLTGFHRISTELSDSQRWIAWYPLSSRILDTPSLSINEGILAVEFLQCIALARILAPARVNISVPIELVGLSMAEVALSFGADDLGFSAVNLEASEQLGVPLVSDKHLIKFQREQNNYLKRANV